MSEKIKVLVVGCGNMGASHAKAYHAEEGFEICGIVSRGKSKAKLNEQLGGGYDLYSSYDSALEMSGADAVCISTYPDTHEEYAIKAFDAGCHVFLEKPVAPTVAGCERVVAAAQKAGKKLVVGYILRHHPSWMEFIKISKTLGKPLVMRMNLNQQSNGHMWDVHKNLMNSMSPIVDCGVHYVDVMCQMTGAKPIRVSGIGARLSEELVEGMYNYGQLQVTFDDGSVGWYEAGWGPMASTKAFFVKDVWGPEGCVTITAKNASDESQSDNVDAHTKTEMLRVHSSEIDADNNFVNEDEWISTEDEPDHDGLCLREQQYFYKAIVEDVDLTDHMNDAINSLKIVLAADESFKTGKTIEL
ncbi:MAG: Gfo/Idh/MocA family oxidoreductase [Lentisphaerales bacterium]|nr:Gfo/Idh/MocA family oxidoreductase [Lentisphaerales bacterium]